MLITLASTPVGTLAKTNRPLLHIFRQDRACQPSWHFIVKEGNSRSSILQDYMYGCLLVFSRVYSAESTIELDLNRISYNYYKISNRNNND